MTFFRRKFLWGRKFFLKEKTDSNKKKIFGSIEMAQKYQLHSSNQNEMPKPILVPHF